MIIPRISARGLLELAGGVLAIILLVALLATRTTLAQNNARFADWREAVATASAAASAKALSEKLKREAQHEMDAKNAQADFDALRSRYAAVVRQQIDRRSPGGTDLPIAAAPAGVSSGAAQSAGLPQGSIFLSVDDALICADNTAYAMAAHQWAASLEGSENGD